MLIVGELINTSRKTIKSAVEQRNYELIHQIAQDEVQSGADYVDLNCGTMIHDEAATMEWLVGTVQEAVTVPLCLDSPDPVTLETGLKLSKNGQPMINSITAEKDRFAAILPLVLKYKAKIVTLCMDDKGMPQSATDRIAVAQRLVADLTSSGVPEQDIYLDPLVTPISTGDGFGLDILDTVRFIRKQYPNVHVICGLSNISYGLPNRKILNHAFLIQTMTSGMDAYILDPLDNTMMGFMYASQALLGQDPFCGAYLRAYRRGLYE